MPGRSLLLGRAVFAVLIPFLWGSSGGIASAAGSAGQSVANQASASHGIASGGTGDVLSNLASLDVLPVSGILVSPDDLVVSAFIASDPAIVRLFLVTNQGNRDDRFRITAASVSPPALLSGIFLDLDGNGAIDPADPPVSVGTTASPLLPPGGSLGVLFRFSAVGLATGTPVILALTAESLEPGAINGLSTDTGTIRNQVGSGALFSDPADPGQPPVKTVDGQARVSATGGQEVSFALLFANSGSSPATNVLVSDPLAGAFSYVPGSLRLDGIALTDVTDGDPGEFAAGIVSVRLVAVAPGEAHRVEFRARVAPVVPSGTMLPNQAAFSADGVSPVDSSRALVLVDPFGLVFEAGKGSGLPGADVSLFVDPALTIPLLLPPTAGAGAVPNLDNLNPFTADSLGRYSFLPDASQIGAPGSPAVYFVRVTRAGYLTRLLQIRVEPSPASTPAAPVYTLTVSALDGLPLAAPGTFTLVAGPVVLADVSSIGFNLPLVPTGALSLTKTSDRSHARIGETVGYRVQILNRGVVPVAGVTLTDVLPEFLDPVERSSRRISGGATSRIDPVATGRSLRFSLGDLAPGEQVEISYRARVAPGAPATPLSNRATATGTLPTGDPTSAGPVRAVVFIRQGIFSFQQVLIGRVFEDLDGNGVFDSGDGPFPGVRVTLDNGMSATSDSQGLYSLPTVPEGARMIGMDPTTYPPGYCPPNPERFSDRGTFRLLRTPLGGGALLKQNFILVRDPSCPRREEAGKAAAHPAEPVPTTPAAGPTALPPPLSRGTHVAEQMDALPPVQPGGLVILQPAEGFVAMSGGLDLVVRTHRSGRTRVSVNDHLVEGDRIGRTDLDDRNQLATFAYVGIPVLPGPNRVSVEALKENGEAGDRKDLTIYGRGAVERIRILADRESLPADGHSSSEVRVELLDAWDHPAQDTRVRIRSSAGKLSAEDGAGGRDLAIASRDGVARATLASELATGKAGLRAEYGDLSDETTVLLLPDPRPAFLVGIGEVTVGAMRSDPGVGRDPATPDDGTHGRVAAFYKGSAPGGTLLTAAYDSDRRLNRTADSDRLFDLDPLEQLYPVLGDSSTHFQEAASNGRAYLKLEKERSFLLYGDFEPGMQETRLAEYGRKLTGVKLNLEDAAGDLLTLSAARPGEAFSREVIPASGISGLYRLLHTPVVPGSETVTLEVHDRRNPEAVLSREVLERGTDYDLDPLAGTLLFKRPLDAFGGEFDLVQIVVLYEFQTTGFEGLSWAGRGRKNWAGGDTRLGFSAIGESEEGGRDFHLFATDLLQRLPRSGTLSVEVARSDGRPLNQGNASLGTDPGQAGTAFRVEAARRIELLKGQVRLSYLDVDADFLNPFGASVTPGARRLALSLDPALTERIKLGVAFQDEENATETVDNSRTTGSVKLTATVNEKVGLLGGFDHRDFEDSLSDSRTRSDLLTAGFNLRPSPRLRLSLRREQNLSSNSDPSYPSGTFMALGFQKTENLKYFLRARDSSRPIEAIADISAAGINPPRSRSEIQIGAESRLGTYSTMTSRYQVENGIAGTDSYAVVGLGTRLPARETLSVDFRGEAGLHVAGPGDAFESVSTGLSWLPRERLRTTFRYELRNADGLGQTISAAAVGKPGDDTTLLARLAASDASQAGRGTTVVDFLGGMAVRPLRRDDFGLLLTWNRRDRRQSGEGPGDEVRTLTDTLAVDSVFELTQRLRAFGKAALTVTTDQPAGLPGVSTTTTLGQGRLEYRVGRRWDMAGEVRDVTLWQDRLRRDSLGLEWGFWANEDFRVGLGYGFTGSRVLAGDDTQVRRGFYLNLATKLNRIRDLLRREP